MLIGYIEALESQHPVDPSAPVPALLTGADSRDTPSWRLVQRLHDKALAFDVTMRFHWGWRDDHLRSVRWD